MTHFLKVGIILRALKKLIKQSWIFFKTAKNNSTDTFKKLYNYKNVKNNKVIVCLFDFIFY